MPGFGHRDRMIFSMTEAEWDAVGTFNCTRAASIRMREQLRTIVGQIHPLDVFVDTVHDELVVSSAFAAFPNKINVYARSVNGAAAPLRTIEVPITGLDNPVGVVVDLASDEIIVAIDANASVIVYSRTASGNVAPLRTIQGGATGLACRPHRVERGHGQRGGDQRAAGHQLRGRQFTLTVSVAGNGVGTVRPRGSAAERTARRRLTRGPRWG